MQEDELARALEARGRGGSVWVRNDTFAVPRAGVDEPRGVAVVYGAGITYVGVRPYRAVPRPRVAFRVLERRGEGLVDEALRHTARVADGRAGPTELARALPARFGLGSMYELVQALHLGRIPGERPYQLAPMVFAVGAVGDPVARALVERLAGEVVTMAVVALGWLGLRIAPEPVPVALGRGVAAAGHPALGGRIGELLRERAPRATPRVVVAPPVLGAALLGPDDTGAHEAAGEVLRAWFTPGLKPAGRSGVVRAEGIG
ncbi:ATPase [Streptomyces somaliensis DSM 40738]|uniref:ATPase n=1 Tax=Streptomyces somaliensis (strain ATCC 33201 / DSM 40738 / JCM 12659 / KCTC 9044 / NCTC 11332 / NRRL B-12077 / IP 733) TaxID=1134445 RepID=A0AA44DBS6_STRE0|nr:ATPase [Streptomyces somaliensis DSM 40738]